MNLQPDPVVSTAVQAEIYYDPFDFAIDDNPYPVWERLREEAPLYLATIRWVSTH
jgi:hypothetical protein